jgi:1-deoxy-D-xylulose-5-phosphate reductoisomerase
VALNVADEVAVATFLEREIGFNDIPAVIKAVLGETSEVHPESIKKVLDCDAEARRIAREVIANRKGVAAR